MSGNLQGPMQYAVSKAMKMSTKTTREISKAEQLFQAVKNTTEMPATYYAKVVGVGYSTAAKMLQRFNDAKLAHYITRPDGRFWYATADKWDQKAYDEVMRAYEKTHKRKDSCKVKDLDAAPATNPVEESLKAKLDVSKLTLAEAVYLRNELNKLLK